MNYTNAYMLCACVAMLFNHFDRFLVHDLYRHAVHVFFIEYNGSCADAGHFGIQMENHYGRNKMIVIRGVKSKEKSIGIITTHSSKKNWIDTTSMLIRQKNLHFAYQFICPNREEAMRELYEQMDRYSEHAEINKNSPFSEMKRCFHGKGKYITLHHIHEIAWSSPTNGCGLYSVVVSRPQSHGKR